MALKLMGKKRGMICRFDDNGRAIPCTVIEIDPNVVVQIKSDKDGYKALQLGCEKVTAKDPRRLEKRTSKPQRGHFKKADVEPRKHLMESRMEDVADYEVGQEFGVSYFSGVKFIDVVGTTIGKGYQGVMKLHNFAGGPAAHGSGFHRHAGSTGMRSTPGRCLPGGKRASHMGHRRQTTQSLEVISIDEGRNVILVKGAVPGPKNGLVCLSQAIKKSAAAAA